MFLNSLLASSFYDSAEPVVFWLTIAILCTLVVVGAGQFAYSAVLNSKGDTQSSDKIKHVFAKYVKYALIGFIFYALVIGLLMVIANLVKRTRPEYLDKNYLNSDVITYVLVPLIASIGVVLVCGIVLFFLTEKFKENKSYSLISSILSAIILLAIVCAAVMIYIYYNNHIKDGGYYDGGYGEINQIGLYLSSAVLVIAAIAAAFVIDRKGNLVFEDSRCITLAGITIALSFALSYIRPFSLPQGGSVTLASLLPIMLFSYVYGTKKGLYICLIYGLLQAIQDPYIIHPAQFLLDYPIAFALVGFAGAFSNIKALEKLPQVKFALGAILGGTLRYVAHLLSGVFAFSAYALDAGFENFWAYSAAYNSFVFVDILIVIVVGVVLFSSKAFNKQLLSYSNKKTINTQQTVESEAAEENA